MQNINESKIVLFEKVSSTPFPKNQDLERILKRTERIVSAVFLVSNKISKSDILFQKTREVAVRLIDNVLDTESGLYGMGDSGASAFLALIREEMLLLRLLHMGGLLSQSNTALLIQSLDELGISVSVRAIEGGAQLTKDDLAPRVFEVTNENKDRKATESTFVQKNAAESLTASVPDNSNVSENKKFRTQSIKDALSRDVLVGIKDICVRFPEYSEKMVQRELAALVDAGVVKKVGEKRWSRYGLL